MLINITALTNKVICHLKRKQIIRVIWEQYLAFLFVPVVLLLRFISPLILVRYGSTMSARIGHFAFKMNYYLCEKEHGLIDNKCFDIFYHGFNISNYQLKKMWDRHPDLRINKFAWLLYSANKLLPNSERYEIEKTDSVDSKNLVVKSKIHLQFTHDEIKEAQTDLRKMGIPADSAYIGLIARDSGYLKTVFPERNWDYHNYRDSNIDNYVLAAEELAARGHYVLRMGAAVENPFKTNNPKIIDYAMNGYRTDLLDIYIAANCYFFISTGTGMDEIPVLFRRPVVRVNYVPIEWIRGWLPDEITIFKKHWLKDKKRFMTIMEIIESGAGRWTYSELFEEHGIEPIENTPEEIRDVVTEMEKRLKGVWETTEEDEELQKRFWSFFKPGELNPVFRSRIGAEFLRQNKEMLE